MEHLYKLKKDGKTVGYCKLIKYRDPLDSIRRWVGWGYSKDGKKWGQRQTTFDTAHPFVTKDKNGKDVFAGDSVRSGKRVLTVVWGESNLRWMAQEEDIRFQTPLCQWAISEQFELIKDKDNA